MCASLTKIRLRLPHCVNVDTAAARDGDANSANRLQREKDTGSQLYDFDWRKVFEDIYRKKLFEAEYCCQLCPVVENAYPALKFEHFELQLICTQRLIMSPNVVSETKAAYAN